MCRFLSPLQDVFVRVRRDSHNNSFGKVVGYSETDDEQDFCDHYESSDLCYIV